MKIDTVEEWNLVGCCCAMPLCPVPTKECQSGLAGYYANSLNEFEGTKYLTITQKYWYYEDNGSGPYHEAEEITTTIRYWGLAAGPCGETNPPPSHYVGTPLENALITAIEFVSRADPFDLNAFKTQAFADFATYVWDDGCTYGTSCNASTSGGIENPYSSNALLQKVRFKWVVPDTWEGSYFKVTWDILEEPTSGSPFLYLTDQTWTWEGPGDPAVEESWKSDWYVVEPPLVAGSRRVVNIRFECYKSAKMGNKPQITGEAFEE